MKKYLFILVGIILMISMVSSMDYFTNKTIINDKFNDNNLNLTIWSNFSIKGSNNINSYVNESNNNVTIYSQTGSPSTATTTDLRSNVNLNDPNFKEYNITFEWDDWGSVGSASDSYISNIIRIINSTNSTGNDDCVSNPNAVNFFGAVQEKGFTELRKRGKWSLYINSSKWGILYNTTSKVKEYNININITGNYYIDFLSCSRAGASFIELYNFSIVEISKIFSVNSQTYNINAYEYSNENFKINITYNSSIYPIATATLNYNGTNYNGINLGNGIFSADVNILSANKNGENRTFYWIIGLTDLSGTNYYNSSFSNQTVNFVNVSDCVGSLTQKALNFTAYDQNTLSQLSGWDFRANFFYYGDSITNSKNVTFTNLGITEKDICITNNSNLKLSGQIEYSLDGYNTVSNFLTNYDINNVTKQIKIYLLNTSLTTAFIIKVQSQNQLPLQNYYVNIYKIDPGSFTPYLTASPKTDSLGQTIGFFEANTVDYVFVITDSNGTVVYTSEQRKIIPTTTPYTLTFTVGSIIPSPYIYIANVTGVSWNLAFNKATNIASLSYSDSNTSFVSGLFTVKIMNFSGSNNVMCNVTSINPSAILICNLTGNQSGSYYAEFYLNRGNYIFVDSLSFDIEGMSSAIGMLGVLGAFFILLICAFAFAWNEVAGIISMTVGFIFCNIIGFLNFGIVGISASVGIAVLLLAILEWG